MFNQLDPQWSKPIKAVAGKQIVSGIELIAAERQRQVQQEGWSIEHDAMHVEGELRDAAICYAMVCDPRAGENVLGIWPWETIWWKPSEDQVRNLVKAGALIAAEIDRLQAQVEDSETWREEADRQNESSGGAITT